MEKRKLKIRDLTLRDGQQSLFATRLSQKEIDKLLPYYENAGFYIMEVWGGAVPDSVMRFLDESPWNRLRSVSKVMKGKSLLSALSRGRNLFGYVPYPNSVLEGFYKEAIANGLNVMRIFDALNDIDNVRDSIKMINQLGGIPDGAVCYTVDPKEDAPAAPAPAAEPAKKGGFFSRLFGKREETPAPAPAPTPQQIFTAEYFVEKAKEMERIGAQMITLKDMAGLVTPARAAEIISKLKANLKVPVDFHTHCTPGYGLASSIMAIISGVDILDTNIWWFGGGSAAPAIELIYLFADPLGVEIDVDMEAVGRIRTQLLEARKSLRDFDLNADKMPKAFDPLKDTVPAEVQAQVDKAVAAAKAHRYDDLLDACHAIEAYFGFPKPNELVKNAEVPGGMYSNMVAQLKQLKAEDLLDDAMRLIPMVRRDAGLVPLVTPTSQIVGSQAVAVALDRKKGEPDYSHPSNQFISLVKGEYGKTPVPVKPEFREKITGSPVEQAYDVTKHKTPDNPTLPDFGGVKLAKNKEEELLLELLPTVANGFLKKRRKEEFEANKPAPAEAKADATVTASDAPITGPTIKVPMPGKIIEIKAKSGQKVNKGDVVIVYEAMKMENDVQAPQAGVVKRIFVAEGDAVADGQVLLEFEEAGKVAPVTADDKPAAPAKSIKSPMPGKIIEVKVKPGQKVKKNDVVLVYEAMKMENDVQAPEDMEVTAVLVAPDDAVADGQALIEYK